MASTTTSSPSSRAASGSTSHYKDTNGTLGMFLTGPLGRFRKGAMSLLMTRICSARSRRAKRKFEKTKSRPLILPPRCSKRALGACTRTLATVKFFFYYDFFFTMIFFLLCQKGHWELLRGPGPQ
jgi:hypothetical protein